MTIKIMKKSYTTPKKNLGVRSGLYKTRYVETSRSVLRFRTSKKSTGLTVVTDGRTDEKEEELGLSS